MPRRTPSPEEKCEVRRGFHTTGCITRMLTGEELGRARAEGSRSLSHFATCPSARRHRKRKETLETI